MIDAEEHTSFVFGHKKLKNIKDLIEVLENKEFEHIAKGHVNDDKNDYANWIKHVLKDEDLAYDVSQEKEISKIVEILKKKVETEEIKKAAEVRVEELIKNPTHLKKEEIVSKPENKSDEKNEDHILKKEVSHHKEVLKHAEPRHFCPKFFDCMKKEFLFGFALGIIVGIVIAVFVKIGAI